jgi:ssDNA-binding Zn-finger/Zn-ribbon topoisomerase 1
MGLRCLLGHEFGGREVERDRREDGDEVVVAYRTVETCERCGTRRVVSENKEIKPLRSARDDAPEPADEQVDPATGPESESESESESRVEVPATPGGGAAEDDADVATSDTDAGAADAPTAGVDLSDASREVADASDDAAIILDDATDVGDDGPTDGASEADDERAWPETAGGDEDETETEADDGFDAETPTPGGPTVSVDDDTGDAGGAAAWPNETEDGVERDSNGTRFVRPASGGDDPEGETEFHCPNCGGARPAASSSLRPGDVCPDCRKGYLAERTGRNA